MALRRPGATTTRWRRPLEWLLFAGPTAAGACFVGLGLAVHRFGDPSFDAVATALVERPAVALAALAVLVLVGLAWTVGLAAALYHDAETVAGEASGWDPRGPAYAALVLVVPVAALHYLRRRHRHVEPAPEGRRWWLGFPIATLLLVIPFVAVRQGMVPSGAVLAGQGLGLALLPAAAYRDAAYVRGLDASWRPDPALHFAVAALAAILALPLPLYAGYYLLRRRVARSDR